MVHRNINAFLRLVLPLAAVLLGTSESVSFLHRGSQDVMSQFIAKASKAFSAKPIVKSTVRLDRVQKAKTENTSALTANSHVVNNVSALKVGMANMPIEDGVLGLDATAKQELLAEVTQAGGAVNQAINFIKTNANEGWSPCALDGQTCTCTGMVRYGSHAGGFPTFTAAVQVSGSILCSGPTFSWAYGARDQLHCQCADSSEHGWQNAKLRFNSVSYLQEAWVGLTRVLAQSRLLPFNGDRSWNGESLFSLRGSGSHDRTYMDMFLQEVAPLLPQHPVTCMEWAPITYASMFPACAHSTLSLEFQPDINQMHTDAANKVHCDNVHLSHCLGGRKIDIAINTNVWEHEIEPFAAMQSLYDAMNPGSLMIFTVPFVAPYHGVPYDFYRYTKSGVTHVLERAGFCVPRSMMRSGGDFINDIALFAGVGPGDFSAAEIAQAYHKGYDSIPDGALVMMAVAFKKVNPNDACPA